MERPRSTQPPRRTINQIGHPSTWGNHNVVAPDARFNPQTQTKHNYETYIRQWALKGYQWCSCSDGQMPSRAVQRGTSRTGEPLYIARALSPGMTQCPGIFHPSSGQCYFFWKGREYYSSTYDILCQMPKLQNRATRISTTETETFGDSMKVMTIRSPLKLSNYNRK